MTKIIAPFILLFCFGTLISCERIDREDNKNKKETPKALQDKKLDITSYSRSSGHDLTEELYAELVSKSPELKKVENDISAIKQKQINAADPFNKYNNKSNQYYISADHKANTISDSLLRNRVMAMIGNSKNQYNGKTRELNELLSQISKNGTSISDQHSVLKILLTLPAIEKYQKENIPDSKDFRNVIKEQGKLIQNLDSLTPKF